jgi:hypothetical protein
MLDLHYWYARLHGPRAVRIIQTALTDEARERAAAAPPASSIGPARRSPRMPAR